MSIHWLLPVIAALIAGILMPVAIRTRWLGHDDDFGGVQKVHDVPTSRLGGLNVFFAYAAAMAIALRFNDGELFEAFGLMLCAVPVVLVGLWEDVTRAVRPWLRLAAAVASAVLASWFADGIIARLDLPIVDRWLAHLAVVLPLTWFMVAGACNAVNLIDGAHGLAGGTALMMFGGLGAAAALSGDGFVAIQALTVAGAIVGFLVWNYPRGKVFLGDAGAYFLGFMYAELSIAIVARNPEISAWFVIALAAYPITETLYSIYRRKVLLRTASMEPDAGHLHSLVFRKLVMRGHAAHAHDSVRRANARVAPRMWAHGAVCLAAALWFADSTLALIAFSVFYVVAYVVIYRALARSGREHAGAEPDPRPARR